MPKPPPSFGTSADIADGLALFIDFRFNCDSFEEWISSPIIMKKMGDYYYNEYNLVMAAEWYGYSAELLGDYDELATTDLKYFLLDVILLRGECLMQLGSWNESEFCAHHCYKLKGSDIRIIYRAAKCCRKPDNTNNKNNHMNFLIHQQLFKVRWLISLIRSLLRQKVHYRREKYNNMIYKKASTIQSLMRMVIVRNKYASEIAGGLSIIKATRFSRR